MNSVVMTGTVVGYDEDGGGRPLARLAVDDTAGTTVAVQVPAPVAVGARLGVSGRLVDGAAVAADAVVDGDDRAAVRALCVAVAARLAAED